MVIEWNPDQSILEEPNSELKKAAEYVRMSTEHQKYSTDNQSVGIRKYAASRGYDIVRTYADQGKSGLNIDGRSGLQQLLVDIESGQSDFEVLLVFDVSRWGRFQDPDEAASYELRCRRNGVEVHYCAEQFENDGSIGSSIIKTVKRAMAGEYSRELSEKVFAGQSNLIQKGYRQGGPAGFGLRRLLIDEQGNPKNELGLGEHKSIATDRVILTPGPPEEIAIVNEIFRSFIELKKSEIEIAEELNGRGVRTDQGSLWTRGTIHQLLINEKYIGNNVWGKTSFKLKHKHIVNEESDWVRADKVFEPIVDDSFFQAAQSIIASRTVRMSDEEMLELLSKVHLKNGHLSGLIIDETEHCPSSSVFRSRFGSLLRAYELVGFAPETDYSFLETNKKLRKMHSNVVSNIVCEIEATGAEIHRNPKTDLMTINSEFTASLIIARCQQTSAGSARWKLRFDAKLCPDITIAARMDEANIEVKDYYILPRLDMREAALRLCEYNGLSLDSYRFESLDSFYQLTKRRLIREAA